MHISLCKISRSLTHTVWYVGEPSLHKYAPARKTSVFRFFFKRCIQLYQNNYVNIIFYYFSTLNNRISNIYYTAATAFSIFTLKLSKTIRTFIIIYIGIRMLICPWLVEKYNIITIHFIKKISFMTPNPFKTVGPHPVRKKFSN